MSNWRNCKTTRPPMITCHVREGCTQSVELVVMDEFGTAWQGTYCDEQGVFRCYGGGVVPNPRVWTYAPDAWEGVLIDKEQIEINLVKMLMDSELLDRADPEQILNDLYDPPGAIR